MKELEWVLEEGDDEYQSQLLRLYVLLTFYLQFVPG